jgi:hypothetical protein
VIIAARSLELLVWLAPAFEEAMHWTRDDERELGRFMKKKMPEIQKSVRKIRRGVTKYREVNLGSGPRRCQFSISFQKVGYGFGDCDFMQNLGIAPTTGLNIYLLAIVKEIDTQVPAFVGRIYDDGKTRLKILGRIATTL